MISLRSDALASGLLFVIVGILGCFAPIQSDTWWLLRAGQDIFTTGIVPFADSYSHTAAGSFWWNHEWLTEVLFFVLYRLTGLPGLVVASAAAILLAWLISWRLTRGPFETRFVALALAIPAAAGSWAVRPQVFSTLIFVAICWLLATGRRLYWIPVLVIFWINLHGTAVLSLVAIAGALAAVTIVRRQMPWDLLWTFVASGLATAVTPLGFRMYPEIARSIERSRMNQLIEWLPPGFTVELWPFWALVAILPVTAVLRRRSIDDRTAKLIGIALAVLPLAVRSTRTVHVFLLAAIPAVTSAWAGTVPAPPVTPRRERERVNGGILVAAIVAASVFVVVTWLRSPPRLGWNPIGAEAVAAVNACAGPLYNSYGDGGILIWFAPARPVFIDNRQDPYPDDLLRLSRNLESYGRYDDVFLRYGITCAAVRPDSIVFARLLDDPRWSVTHREARWAVLERKPAP